MEEPTWTKTLVSIKEQYRIKKNKIVLKFGLSNDDNSYQIVDPFDLLLIRLFPCSN